MNNTCDFIIVNAPLPISQNRKDAVFLLKRKSGGMRGSIGSSKEYVNYSKNVFWPWWCGIRAKGRMRFGQEVLFWTITCPKRAGCDTDNYHKVFLDCLEQNKAFPNDNVVVSTHNERGPRVSGGLLRVFMANESRREELSKMYWEEYNRRWAPTRSGPILSRPQSLDLQRFAALNHSEHSQPVQSSG